MVTRGSEFLYSVSFLSSAMGFQLCISSMLGMEFVISPQIHILKPFPFARLYSEIKFSKEVTGVKYDH